MTYGLSTLQPPQSTITEKCEWCLLCISKYINRNKFSWILISLSENIMIKLRGWMTREHEFDSRESRQLNCRAQFNYLAVSATFSVSANVLLPGEKRPGRKTYRSLLPSAKFTVHNLTEMFFIAFYCFFTRAIFNYIFIFQQIALN
jgi:hypothetical protein